MKRIYPIAVFLLIAFAFSGSAWKSSSPSKKTFDIRQDSSSLPSGISKILDQSCLVCHGTGGKAMATAHLNVSGWDGYSSEKQAQKASAICKMVTGGKMPPKGYLKSNPQATLTQEQINSLCAWSASLNQGK